jgi:hypothetical protein
MSLALHSKGVLPKSDRQSYVIFQMAEVAVPRGLFHEILRLIAELRPPPVTSTA